MTTIRQWRPSRITAGQSDEEKTAKAVSPARLACLMLLVIVAICGVFCWTLYQSYDDVRREAGANTRNIASAVVQDITRTIETLDLSLQAAVDGWYQPELIRLSPTLQNMVLFDRSADSSYTGGILIVDETGAPVRDARSIPPRVANLSDTEMFIRHRESSDLGLLITGPFRSTLTGEWSLGLSRRLNHADGSFAGAAVTSIRLPYFLDMFSRLSMGENSAFTLVMRSGTVVARYPNNDAIVGKSITNSAVFQRMVAGREGEFQSVSSIDGQERLYAYKPLGDYPLIQSVAISQEKVFTAWWRRASILIGMVCALCICLTCLTAIFTLELKRRIAAEAQLAAVARTDALTKLGNRRFFDETLDYEWARAARDRATVSLLMIDTDCFKGYNDAHGHVAGDAALTAIGASIGARLRRPADSGSRYGGEEFAVILPNTPLRAAMRLAELIRRDVEALAIAHAGSAAGVITVSIGVAAANLATAKEAVDLVMYADAALYAAKAEGRNRISAHIEPDGEQRAA